MRVVVTGGSGTVGRRLREDLIHAGHDVVVLGRSADTETGVLGTSYGVDELREHLCQADAIAHLAWRRTPSDRFEDFVPSITATENLLQACVAEGVQRLVAASSISVYSGTPPWSEGDLPRPTTAYGLSKLVGEGLIQLASQRGLSSTSLRIGHVYTHDESNDYAVNVFIDRAARGEQIIVTGDSQRRRDMVYVGDVSHAIMLALSNPASPQALNIGSGRALSSGDIAEAAAAAFGGLSKVVRKDVPAGGEGSTEMDITAAAETLEYVPQANIYTAMSDIARRRRLAT